MKNRHYHILVAISLLTWLLTLAAIGILLYRTYTRALEDTQQLLAADALSSTEIEARLQGVEKSILHYASIIPLKDDQVDIEAIQNDTINGQKSTLDSMRTAIDNQLQTVFENKMSYALVLVESSASHHKHANPESLISPPHIKNKILGDLDDLYPILGTYEFKLSNTNDFASVLLYYEYKDLQSITLDKINRFTVLSTVALLVLTAFMLYAMWLINRFVEEKDDQEQFIENISATLQDPLTTIKTSSASQMQFLSENRLADAKRMGSYIHAQTARLQQIVDQIQHNADTDLKQKLNKREVSLSLLFKHCIDDMKIKYPNRPINISVALNPEELEMVCDPLYIKSAILNILDNALHYNEEDMELFVEITANRVHDYTLITISDNGVGVDHDELPRLKEKYYRPAQHRHISGLGLGLYQVNQIVQAHDGVVKLRGDHTAGFAVELKFPHSN